MTEHQPSKIIDGPPRAIQLAESDVRLLARLGVPKAVAEIADRDAMLALIPGGPDDDYNFGQAWVGGFDYEPEDVAKLEGDERA